MIDNSHDRFDRRKPGDGGSKQGREESLESLLRRMTDIAGLEMETVAQTSTFVLERALKGLFELLHFWSCAAVWPNFTVEVRDILHDFRETIDLVEALQKGARGQSHREVLQLRGATSKVPQRAVVAMNNALSLTEQIMRQGFKDVLEVDGDTNHDPTRATIRPLCERLLHTLHVAQLESHAILQLFTAAQDEGGHPTVLDLLAGCAFQRCWILPHEDYKLPTYHAPIVMSPESAASAVLLSLTALEYVQASVFGLCIVKPTAIDDAVLSLSDAQEFFEMMSSDMGDPRALALRKLAELSAPLRAYIDGEGNAVVSILLPHQAHIFERRITQELDTYMQQFVQVFTTIQLDPLCSTRSLETGFEIAITLPIPTTTASQLMREVTNTLLVEHLAMAENLQARTQTGTVSFRITHGGAIRTVELVRNLFETPEFGVEVESDAPSPMTLVADALEFFGLVDDATYLDIFGSSYTSYMVTIGRDVNVSSEHSASGALSALSSSIDLRLRNPTFRDAYFLDRPRNPICSVPAHVVSDRAFFDEFARLSKVVTIEHLDLSFLLDGQQDDERVLGAQLIKNLRDLIELDGERLSEFERLRLHTLPVEMTYRTSPSTSLHFYLSGSGGSLCGIGSLPLKGGIADLSVFPKSTATKCGQLVNAIVTSLHEMNTTEGPWTWRLHQELLAKNFALSDELVQELYEYRKRSFSELMPATIAELLYSRIAEAPSRFLLSEQFRLTDQSAFTLSVLAPEDMQQWRNQ